MHGVEDLRSELALRRQTSTMRNLIFVVLLAAAAFVPYALTNKDWQTKLSATWNGLAGSSQPGAAPQPGLWDRVTSATQSLFGGKPTGLGAAPLIPNAPVTPLIGEPVTDFREVIRFDVTPDWVMSRWGRVSTVVSEPGLEGFRVALVTGSQTDDLAGSLTYYFDKQRTVQRVTFRGTTGDGTRLVRLVQETYSFKQDPSVVSQLYTLRWSGKILSALRLTNPPVVRAGQPYQKLEALLEINRPGSPFGISGEMQQVLRSDAVFVGR